MGNQPTTICCADTTGRVDIASTSSYENRGKPRLLRRVIDTFRPVPKGQPTSGFFKGKFASSTMEMETTTPGAPQARSGSIKMQQTLHNQDSRQPPPDAHLRSLSSMSTQSEVGGERYKEARSDMLSRRSSYCSAREGVEDEREQLEPEGDRIAKPQNE